MSVVALHSRLRLSLCLTFALSPLPYGIWAGFQTRRGSVQEPVLFLQVRGMSR